MDFIWFNLKWSERISNKDSGLKLKSVSESRFINSGLSMIYFYKNFIGKSRYLHLNTDHNLYYFEKL